MSSSQQTPRGSAPAANSLKEIQTLLKEALDEEDRRLASLEERVELLRQEETGSGSGEYDRDWPSDVALVETASQESEIEEHDEHLGEEVLDLFDDVSGAMASGQGRVELEEDESGQATEDRDDGEDTDVAVIEVPSQAEPFALPALPPAAESARSGEFAELTLDPDMEVAASAPAEESGEDSDIVSEREIQAARALLAESGRHLHELQQKLLVLEGTPRDVKYRRGPAPAAQAQPPVVPVPGPRTGEYHTPRPPADRDPTPIHQRPTRPLPPHEQSQPQAAQYGLERAFGGGRGLRRILQGQVVIQQQLTALKQELAGVKQRQAAVATAAAAASQSTARAQTQTAAHMRARELHSRAEQAERALAEARQEQERKDARLDSVLSGLERLFQQRIAAAPTLLNRPRDPAPGSEVPPSGMASPAEGPAKRLVRLIRSSQTGRARRPTVRDRLLELSSEHQGLVQAQSRLFARLLQLLEEEALD